MANRLGDSTAKHQGRLTLDPKVHIDPLGAILILIVGFGWAKPVPVNIRNFKNPKRDMAISAVAGPISNFIVAFTLLTVLILLYQVTTLSLFILIFFQYAIFINLVLGIFNLIPIPPLDGSRILAAFLPSRQYYKLMQYEQYFFIVIIVLVALSAFTGFIAKVTNFFLFFMALPFQLLGFKIPFGF
jgi:Zn-dependent protease